jgi:hypothetical protein
MMSNFVLLHCQHTIRVAATRKPVAVTKRESKSAGVHAGGIVVWISGYCQEKQAF